MIRDMDKFNASLEVQKQMQLDYLKESYRRFPRLICTGNHQETSYYWNYGSDEGLRIVTFITDDVTMKEDCRNYSITYKYR